MALVNRRNVQEAEAALAQWLSARSGKKVTVSGARIPHDSGFSNETIVFDAADAGTAPRRLVARVQPRGPGAFPTYDLLMEFKVLQALHGDRRVPVPQVLYYEDDRSILGAPFLVMEFVQGRVPPDDPPFTRGGWVLDDLGAHERSVLSENAIEALVQVHRTDWRRLELGFVERRELGVRPIDQWIAYYEQFFEWAAEGEENPVVSAAFEWIRAHVPAEPEPVVLNWGDCRIGNIVFDSELNVAAVLDWEMVTLASPELDLGWWLYLTRYYTEGMGLTLPDGIAGPDRVIARYEELAGYRCRHLEFYELFAGLRVAIMIHRGAKMMVEAGLMPPGTSAAVNNPATVPLARLLGMPELEGATEALFDSR
jgi:aminoglycoside phosphotransferase (APT) family kinase protein